MLHIVSNDSAPPLIYIVQHFIATFWYSQTSIRILSALGGIAAIPLAWAIGRRIAGDRGAFWAGFGVAIFPASVMASRDARMYALAMTFSLGAILTLWRFTEKRSFSRWLAFTAVCSVCVYTDYFTAFAIAGSLAAMLIWLRPSFRTVVAAGAGAALAVASLAPWLLYARGQLSHAGDAFWVNPIDIFNTSGVVLQFFAGPPTDPGVPMEPLQHTVQAIVQLPGIIAFVALFRKRKELSPAKRKGLWFLVGSGLLAISGLVLISFWHPLVEARYASAMWGSLLVALGIAVGMIANQKLRAVVVASMLLCTTTLLVLLRNPDTPKVVANIPALGPHDMVDSSAAAYLLLQYYGDDSVKSHTKVVLPSVAWYWGTAAYPPGAVTSTFPSDVLDNHGTIYYIDVPGWFLPTVPQGYAQASGEICYSTLCITAYKAK